MCILIVLRGVDRDAPLWVAGNREERRDRPAAPPGVWQGQRLRVLSPRDKQAGGTWLAIDAAGRCAGLTNLIGEPAGPGAPSRGHLPHLALDAPNWESAIELVQRQVAAARYGGFQLVLADGERVVILRHRRSTLEVREWSAPVLVVTNEHGPGELEVPGLSAAAVPGLPAAVRFQRLLHVLRDPGGPGRHAVCKAGGEYGTVSSSILMLPRDVPRGLCWWYAPGSPDRTEYRNYGNLGRRLLPEVGPGAASF